MANVLLKGPVEREASTRSVYEFHSILNDCFWP